MKTNVGIVTTDEQRKVLAKALGKKGMVSRNDIKEAVDAYITLLLTGADCTSVLAQPVQHRVEVNAIDVGKLVDSCNPQPQGREPDLAVVDDPIIRTNDPGVDFQPSRGDEPYLFKAKDPQLHQLHTNLLDALGALENYTWCDMEANRNDR